MFEFHQIMFKNSNYPNRNSENENLNPNIWIKFSCKEITMEQIKQFEISNQ